MPGFWLGLMLMMLFAVRLRLLPASGDKTATSIILPAVTLAVYQMALIARTTRSSMLEVIGQDYIRTARAKGLPERVITIRHALGNAMIPIITIVGLQVGFMLGGSIITETVFAWPGLGLLLADAVRVRDYTVIQGICLIYSLVYITVNLITDLIYAVVDPRVVYT
jgi:ABC-type dipeptide/oligopeptide/nickel transport system permease component